ncbi:MAG: hypothetical protein U0P45_00865 [Acidimicrobiales bacterium]
MASSTSRSTSGPCWSATSRTLARAMAWTGGWQIALVAVPEGACSAVPHVFGPGS